MKAKSIKGKSPEEIQSALLESIVDGFRPTLAILFISIKQDRKAVIEVLRKEDIDLLGSMKEAEYESNVIVLNPGDSLFFFTDGVTEAFNNNNEEYGESRLSDLFSQKNYGKVNELINDVFEDVQQFAGGAEQSDDITCLALKYCKLK